LNTDFQLAYLIFMYLCENEIIMSAYNKGQNRYNKSGHRRKPMSSERTAQARTPAPAKPRKRRTSFGATMIRMLLPFSLMAMLAGYLISTFDVEEFKTITQPQSSERVVETTETEALQREINAETTPEIETEAEAETQIESHSETETVSEDDVFQTVEEMPRFPGCEEMMGTNDEKKSCADKNMLKYVYDNIQYPAEAREKGIQGLVVIDMIIDKEGRISDAKVLREPPESGLGEEALRVVNSMPRWVPGKQRGKAVKVSYKLPVRFELE